MERILPIVQLTAEIIAGTSAPTKDKEKIQEIITESAETMIQTNVWSGENGKAIIPGLTAGTSVHIQARENALVQLLTKSAETTILIIVWNGLQLKIAVPAKPARTENA